MKKKLDCIQFESRAELGEIIHVLESYLDIIPQENDTVEELIKLLDEMEMEW